MIISSSSSVTELVLAEEGLKTIEKETLAMDSPLGMHLIMIVSQTPE